MAAEERAPNMLAEALGYLKAGYPVFPVCSPLMGAHDHWDKAKKRNVPCPPDKRGKNPMAPWGIYQQRLPTEQEVRQAWAKWPNANIGMATGVLSGVVILDCDSGQARQLAMEKGGLDKTPVIFTGKPGGVHYWLAYPGERVQNFVAGRHKQQYPGLDFRGDGGYCVLPPSIHANLNTAYRWADNTMGLRLAPVPPWLMDILRNNASASDGGSFSEREALDYEAILAGVDEGSRDDFLFRAACRFRRDDMPQAAAEALIRQAARACRPPFDEDTAVEKVVRAYKIYAAGSPGPTLDFDDDEQEESERPDEFGMAEDPEDDEGWTVYDAADFLAKEYPVVQWRVQGFLRDQAILFNFGAPGSIKTYIATDAGIAVATGDLFLGQYPCEQGRVLIVQEDTLESDFQQAYLAPLVRARGIDPERLRGQLFIAPAGGMSLDVPERVKELCAWIEQYKPDLLVLDAFYLMHSGEGFGKDLGPIMKRLKAIRGKYGCSIWVIDHDRKGKGDGSGDGNPIDRLWGGRQKSAAVDAIMESRPVKGSHGETFLDVIKLRGAKPGDPIRVTLGSDYSLTVDLSDDKPAAPAGVTNTVYEWLCREGGSRTKAQMSNGTNLSLRSIEGALYALIAEGLAKEVGKVGRAKTYVALRKSDAEPVGGVTIDFGDDEE